MNQMIWKPPSNNHRRWKDLISISTISQFISFRLLRLIPSAPGNSLHLSFSSCFVTSSWDTAISLKANVWFPIGNALWIAPSTENTDAGNLFDFTLSYASFPVDSSLPNGAQSLVQFFKHWLVPVGFLSWKYFYILDKTFLYLYGTKCLYSLKVSS